MQFDQLEVYRISLEYLRATRPLVLRARRVDPALADQLHRALLSIPCNIAEGAGEFSPGDKARFYRYALRSTTETIGLLDSARVFDLCGDAEHTTSRGLGMRIVAMLTRLVKSVQAPARPRAAGGRDSAVLAGES